MLFSRNNGQHTSSLSRRRRLPSSASSFDDVKWAVSVAASLFGSAVALYIFRGEMRTQAEKSIRAETEFARLQAHSEEMFDDLKRREPPGEGAREAGE